ncbi:TssN family type VI secretion system protein [Hymenobacter weizhouensis]|uniref:TssN family type VI secretion system protein n=1 Tax=Hymenobacter sp. YIM 151500-1 TaxID=2987689 RepID=UPI00222752CB|nr:TssN family type VI secretion system protein [Hymenobacter sp. YIM 151500-1]UYZ62601.1 TssN family type VI secretion system protein [Hymenobacter sp. YIM 151500-1]
MLLPDPKSHARSMASSALSNARSGLQRNPTFISVLLYLLGWAVVFALVGLGAVYSPLEFKTTFLLVQALLLLLGAVHTLTLEQFLPWYDKDNLTHGGVMTGLTWGAGVLSILALFWWRWFPANSPAPASFVAATFLFPLPYVFWQAWQAWRRIPAPQYTLWQYRPGSTGPDLARMDLSNFMVVHFWMSRRFGEELYHDFSSKAPYEMRLGDLFHIFITDYNALKPEQALQYVDEQGQSYGWLFYAKQPWWRRRRYYNPDHTFRDNFLRQGSIIVARRVPLAS